LSREAASDGVEDTPAIIRWRERTPQRRGEPWKAPKTGHFRHASNVNFSPQRASLYHWFRPMPQRLHAP
jgi:hypothetical protein